MSQGRIIGLVIVAALHVLLGYAFVTGLALQVVKQIVAPIEAVQVKEEAPPPDEPPPPPPKEQEIPPYVPPPEVTIEQTVAPVETITTQRVVETPIQAPIQAPVQQPVIQAPVQQVPTGPTQRAAPTNQRIFEVSEDDYPPSSKRAEEEGSTRIRVNISTQGRVDSCEVVTSSTFQKLDDRSCVIAKSRWRFKPALKDGQPVADTYTRTVRWVIAK